MRVARTRSLMPATHAARLATFVGLAATLATACNDGPSGLVTLLTTGAVRATMTTTGAELDADGYTLTVDSGVALAVGVNASVTLTDLPAGEHVLWLDGLASNCQLAGPNPRHVTVAGGRATTVAFSVSCVQYTGTIGVTTVTTGTELDPNGYTATIDQGSNAHPSQPIGRDGSVTFMRVLGGEHTVALEGVARNCAVDAPHPRLVTVTPGATTVVAFVIQCATPGSLRLITATSGVDLDPDRYVTRVTHQGSGFDTTAALAVNGTLTIAGLPAGDVNVALGGLSPNCEVIGANPRTVAVPSGGTGEITFNVTCEAATQLAFVNDRDGNAEIYVINSNGSGATRLTTNPAIDMAPAWSPDGAKIAFHSYRDGAAEIYVMNADGSSPARLTSNSAEDYVPAWSPDGTRIAFTSHRDGNGEIYVMNADGTSPVRLTNHDAFDSEPAWSPDGRKIAFISDRDGDIEIYVMNADGSGVAALTSNSDENWSPAWSPDGARIAFARGFDCYYYCQYHLVVMNADGSGAVQLTSGACDEYDPAWSPDGRRIAFTSTRPYYGTSPCPTSVMVVRADGTSNTQLTNGGAYNPTWRP